MFFAGREWCWLQGAGCTMPGSGSGKPSLFAAEGVHSPECKWLIEGWGVEHDIKVDNLPFECYKGKDARMEAAVQYLLKLIKEQPVVIPPVPKYPVKAFDYPDKQQK